MRADTYKQMATGVMLLAVVSCDFVDENASDPHPVSYPSFLTLFNSHINEYTYTAGSFAPPGTEGSLTMEWRNRILPNPFAVSQPVSLMEFSATETVGSSSLEVNQYLTQPGTGADQGSIYLHAIDDVLSASEYWITDVNQGTYTNSSFLVPAQLLFSPFQQVEAVDDTILGEVGVTRSFTYYIMGNCSASVCEQIARVEENFTVNNDFTFDNNGIVNGVAFQSINTLIGDFEAYRIQYNITVTPIVPLNNVIDYRVPCHATDLSAVVSSFGTIFIAPDVGPVRIENTCNVTGALSPRSYTAVLSNTTIDFSTP